MRLSLDKTVAVVLFLCALAVFWITGISNIRDLAEGLVAAYFLTWGLYALLSELPREEVLRRFILTTVASISCLVILELPAIFGRMDYRLVFSTPGVELWRKPGDVMDTELLWVRQPHLRLKGHYERGNVGEALCLPPHAPEQYDLVYDHNGFRNDSDLATADIAVIGDSFVESPMIPSAVLMTSVLGQLHTSTVANLGISGYGPQQELAVLNRYALQLNPKTIVWVFYAGNDLRNVHEYDEQVAKLSQDVEFLKSRWLRSFTRNALWTLFSLPRTCTPNADLAQHYVVAQDAEGRQERVYFVAKENELALSPREMDSLRKIRSTFEAAYQITRERGIQFMVVFAPDTHRVYLGLPNIVEVSDAVRNWKLNDLSERIRTMVAEISPDILYLDLTPSLREATQRGIPVYLQDDTHWTVEGHRIAAEALHQSLAGRVQIATKQSNGENKKNLMVDLAQDAVMVRAPGGAIRYWNKGAEHLYGWASTETLGKSSHRLLKTVFPKPLASIEAELQKTGRWEGELVHERRDGSHVTVASRWELQRNGKDKSATVIEINREQAAKESSRQGTKDSLVDLAQDAVVVRTQDGTIRYWNKGAEHLYGWGPQDTLGKSCHQVLQTIFPKPLPNIEAELMHTGHWAGQLVHKRRDGSKVVVSSRWELQRNAKDACPTVIEINSERYQKS